MKRTWQHYLSAIAALVCAVSVALSAYASHALDADAQRRMLMASYFAFAHGLSLIVLIRLSPARANGLACGLMFTGLMLFSGGLTSAAICQTSTVLVPYGGMALILSWCWIAVNFLRTGES